MRKHLDSAFERWLPQQMRTDFFTWPVKTTARHLLFVVCLFSLLFILFFSPVLFSGHLLAPGAGRLGDAVVYHLAFFKSSKVFWDNLLATGFPMTADPQVMAWYPPALVFSFIPGGWNLFVLSAYVMASCFTYGYLFVITQSRFSSVIGGITYGMCGFMMVHMSHTAVIHSAVWLPLMVWSLEMLRTRLSRRWLVTACGAIACCVLAGHLQIVAYSLIVAASYAIFLGWNAGVGRRRFYAAAAAVFVLGLGLAALQILPTRELASVSMRTEFSFQDFVSYSLPLKQVPMFIFPAAFGGLPRYGAVPYFGEWNLIEMSSYVGLMPLTLATVGLVKFRRNRIAIFWFGVAVTALLLALGEATPLAYLVFRLPALGQFRAPARHSIEIAFAVSVMAGFGASAIATGEVTSRLLMKTVVLWAIIIALCVLFFLSGKIQMLALARGIVAPTFKPWANATIAVPIAIFILATSVIFWWKTKPAATLRRAALIVVLLLDLGSFAWFFNWHFAAPGNDVLNEPPAAARLRTLTATASGKKMEGGEDSSPAGAPPTFQRMLSIRGTLGGPDELIPNLSRLWAVPNATGYGPLLPSRLMYLLSILPDGSIASSWKSADDQSLNLTSVRYVLLPKSGAMNDARGHSWQEENMDVWLGAGCDHPPRDAVQFSLPTPVSATSLGIVSRLACSVSVKEGEEVARVQVSDTYGNVETQSLLAGRDTSEWSYDCPSIKPQMKHQRAPIFSSYPAKMYEDPCEGHLYLATLKLRTTKPITKIEVQRLTTSAATVIEKVSLFDDAKGDSESVSPPSILGSQWRFVEQSGDARIYENTRALPRAWVVSQVITLKPEDVLRTIKTSRFPDGKEFDPSRIALLEKPLEMDQTNNAPGTARIIRLDDTSMEIETASDGPAFLITSDLYYPGWSVKVDGIVSELFRADYAMRGVPVYAGRHNVRFEFKPRSFFYGAAVSVLSLLGLMALITFAPRARRRRRLKRGS